MKTRYYLILPLSLCLTLTACKQNTENESSEAKAPAEVSEELQDEKVVVDTTPAMAPVVEKKAEARPAPRPKASAKPAAAPAKPKGKSETIYVETYGAQGKVWGHVTLNGDRGSGTIHDADENTLAVTVTRHGNELFAIDQNSRQYVFKIKN